MSFAIEDLLSSLALINICIYNIEHLHYFLEYKPDGPAPVLGWSSDRNPSFRVNIGMKGDRLVVQESGLYYVYSQLTLVEYRKPTSGSDGSPTGSIIHEIERWNVVYPDTGVEKLFRHSESRSQTRARPFTEYVSYVGGVIALRMDDEVYVTVSDPNLVRARRDPPILGMYRL